VHFVLDQLLCAKNGELVVGVEDQLLDATLFLLTTNWYTLIKEYICKGYFEDDVPQEEKKMSHHKVNTIIDFMENIYINWDQMAFSSNVFHLSKQMLSLLNFMMGW